MRKDGHSDIEIEQAIAPKTYSTGITGTADVDCSGFNMTEIEITYGDHADTLSSAVDFDVDLEHADPLSTGLHDTFADVAQDDVLGCTLATGAIINHVEDDADTNQVYRIGYVGGKKFLKITVTANGTHATGTIIGVNVIHREPENGPVADTVPTV
jgi:hypothetical protein